MMPQKHHKKDGEWQPWTSPRPTKLPQSNHERVQANQVILSQKKALLKEIIKQTKEAHPNEKRSYREWTLLAVKETQHKLYE